MKERQLGEAYFNALAGIKDSIASELFTECNKLGLTREQIQRIIFVAQGTVEGVGGRAFTSITKSAG